ncbi:MAG: tRNA-specific adenosine deaminase [Opitutae bacterium]|jgi:tRNA(adenine34) deaminase|nr:tRNA-specific adenosine deaminase [Opitutae bacterium]
MLACPFEKIHPSFLKKDALFFMSHAFNLAIDAWNADEVPVGAVMVHQQEIISSAHNQTRSQTDPTAHAEMIAITMAAKKLGDWRLNECELYVTKEPCPMCSGATITSRVGKVFFGLSDPKMGCLGGAISLHKLEKSNHKPEVTGGIMKEPCEAIIQAFFQKQRSQVSA